MGICMSSEKQVVKNSEVEHTIVIQTNATPDFQSITTEVKEESLELKENNSVLEEKSVELKENPSESKSAAEHLQEEKMESIYDNFEYEKSLMEAIFKIKELQWVSETVTLYPDRVSFPSGTIPLSDIIYASKQGQHIKIVTPYSVWTMFATDSFEQICSRFVNLIEAYMPYNEERKLGLIKDFIDRENAVGVSQAQSISADEALSCIQRFTFKVEDEFKVFDEKKVNMLLCYVSSGKTCHSYLQRTAPSHENFTFISVDCDNDQVTPEYIADVTENKTICVAILSKNSLNTSSFVELVKIALGKMPVVIVHDPSSCPFPPTHDQPEEVRNAFSEIAIRFVANYAHDCWKKIVGKLKKKEVQVTKQESTATVAFLSHKQSTGQGIALALFQMLKYNYKFRVFIDVQANFELHDLEKVVSQTLVFVFILTPGIFESYWCLQELKAAVKHKKKIIVVRDFNYEMPAALPEEYLPYKDILEQQIVYDPIYLNSITNNLVASISNLIRATPLHTLRQLGLTNEDALTGRLFRFNGNWIKDGYNFAFQLYLTENLKRKELNTDKIKFVTGNISWTLEETDDPYLKEREGHSGVETVVGYYNLHTRVLRVVGIGIDESGEGMLATDSYHFEISKEGFAFKGITAGNERDWKNTLFGATEIGQYMVHTWD